MVSQGKVIQINIEAISFMVLKLKIETILLLSLNIEEYSYLRNFCWYVKSIVENNSVVYTRPDIFLHH